MKNLNRRKFLQSAAAGISITALGTATVKGAEKTLSEDRIGILVDTTLCVGCRHCEWACRKSHNITTDALTSYADTSVFEEYRRPDGTSLTVVNEFSNERIQSSHIM